MTCAAGSGSGVSGIDPFPFVPPQFLTPGGPFFGFSRNFRWPYSYQFNLSVQRQITSSFIVSAACVGNLTHDLAFAQDINAPTTGALAPACATTAGANIVNRRPIDNAGGRHLRCSRIPAARAAPHILTRPGNPRSFCGKGPRRELVLNLNQSEIEKCGCLCSSQFRELGSNEEGAVYEYANGSYR